MNAWRRSRAAAGRSGKPQTCRCGFRSEQGELVIAATSTGSVCVTPRSSCLRASTRSAAVDSPKPEGTGRARDRGRGRSGGGDRDLDRFRNSSRVRCIAGTIAWWFREARAGKRRLTLKKIAEYPLVVTYDAAFTGRARSTTPSATQRADECGAYRHRHRRDQDVRTPGLGIGIIAGSPTTLTVTAELTAIDASHLFPERVAKPGGAKTRFCVVLCKTSLPSSPADWLNVNERK